VLSRRISEFGLQPVEGDLVFAEDTPVTDVAPDTNEEEEDDAKGDYFIQRSSSWCYSQEYFLNGLL
jgi:hypothetical protein